MNKKWSKNSFKKKNMEKQNVADARNGVCLVCDKGLRRKKAALPGKCGGERTPSKSRRKGRKLVPKG